MPSPARLVPAAFALAALLALAGCSSDDPVDSGTSTTTAAPGGATTTAAPADTTTTAPPSTAVTAAPGQPPTTPTDPTAQQAGQRLLDAWTAGDLDAAVAVVGSDVANALFAFPTPDTLQSLPCRGSEVVVAATECDFSYGGGTVTLVITGNAGNGYRVTNVGLVPAE